MDWSLTYDLAFMSPQENTQKVPQLVFIINTQHLTELKERLRVIASKSKARSETYLGKASDFAIFYPNLFGDIKFGYGSCGCLRTQSDKYYLYLPLSSHPTSRRYTTLTIQVLTFALGLPFTKEAARSDRQQEVILNTSCEAGDYGHAVGGFLSESVIDWLKSYAKNNVQYRGIIESTKMHPEVVAAMKTTWLAVSDHMTRRYASDCNHSFVSTSGAFTLNCFGNACDLSVYPDQFLGEGCEAVNIGCHNLDYADQQLTLLAGLAKICQLARASRDGA